MRRTEAVMGMPVTIEVLGEGDVAGAMAAAFARLREIDETFSTYKPDSMISRINRGELEEAEAPAEVREVLSACGEMTIRTHGFFDIARHGQIDPSGLVKGWAIAEVARLIEAQGVGNYCVEAGGDIAVAGANADGGPWRVGIRHPHHPDQIVKVLKLSRGAVATSGTYERGSHIYNPHTQEPAAGLLSLTVAGPDIVEADVCATAAFAMGPERALEFVIEQGLEGYQIDEHERARFTPGLARYTAGN